jgi:TetR/AcrR family transcriptional regulator, transcriptional repressor for nem operon
MKRISATTPNAKPVSTTAEQILDVAETLIQTRSYSAFSYQDIADALGIRKASIHYHFATKADLGVAVVDRYVERFGNMLAALSQDQSRSSLALLDFYCEPYLQFAQTDDRVCLCGALAAETMALPPQIRERVAGFFEDHQAWLAGILERGAQRGEFTLRASATKTARMFFGALQGALIVKRTTGDMAQLKDVILGLKAQIVPDRGAKTARAVKRRRLRQ